MRSHFVYPPKAVRYRAKNLPPTVPPLEHVAAGPSRSLFRVGPRPVAPLDSVYAQLIDGGQQVLTVLRLDSLPSPAAAQDTQARPQDAW